MSKCMVAYIDWYHERMDGEGGREKIKVDIKDGWSGQGAAKSEKSYEQVPQYGLHTLMDT